jgi:hypothetical protein
MMRITTQIYEINNQDGSSIGEDKNLLHNNIDSIDLSPTLNKGKTLLMSLKRISNSSKQIITSMKNVGVKSSKDVFNGNGN